MRSRHVLYTLGYEIPGPSIDPDVVTTFTHTKERSSSGHDRVQSRRPTHGGVFFRTVLTKIGAIN
jgi:hypothetical protein